MTVFILSGSIPISLSLFSKSLGIAQVVENQTADPWVAGSSLTSGEKCKNC